MFKLLKDAFKVKDIRSRIFFTVLILFVFRLGTHITVPGVDASRLREIADLPFLNMLNLVSGGAMQQFSISQWVCHHILLRQSLFSCCRWILCQDLLSGRSKGKLVVRN